MRVTLSQLRRIIREEAQLIQEYFPEGSKWSAYINKKEVNIDNYKNFSPEDLQQMIDSPNFKKNRSDEAEFFQKQKKTSEPPLSTLESAIMRLLQSRRARDAEESIYRRNAELAAKKEKNAEVRAQHDREEKLVKKLNDIFSDVGNQNQMLTDGGVTWANNIRKHAQTARVKLSDPEFIKQINQDYYKISDGPLKNQRLGDVLNAALKGELKKTGFFKKVFGESEIRQMIRQEMREAHRRRR